MDCEVAAQRYREKVAMCYGVNPSALQTKPQEVPLTVTFASIYQFLVVDPNLFTGAPKNCAKGMDALFYCKNGWVKSVSGKKIQDIFVVHGIVRHSFALNEKPLTPWILINESEKILAAHCNCAIGLLEACSHVGATLFALEGIRTSIIEKKVCDHNLLIRYVNANHPGSSHDSFVWNGSVLNQLLQQEYTNGERNSWLLGDAGYPLTPFLITPFRTGEQTDERQTRFNGIHSKTRITVERSIGVFKNTFRCMLKERQLHYQPEKATQIINVCVALHNLRIRYKMDLDEPELNDEADEDFVDIDANYENAIRIREEIMHNIL